MPAPAAARKHTVFAAASTVTNHELREAQMQIFVMAAAIRAGSLMA
jgi:hypothetical protein